MVVALLAAVPMFIYWLDDNRERWSRYNLSLIAATTMFVLLATAMSIALSGTSVSLGILTATMLAFLPTLGMYAIAIAMRGARMVNGFVKNGAALLVAIVITYVTVISTALAGCLVLGRCHN